VEQQVRFINLYGENLAGTLHLPDEPAQNGVVLGHCFTCTRHTTILRRLAQDLAGAGFIALRFDFSGNGQSEGEFTQSTYSKQITEMQTATDLVVSNGAEWIGMAGHSMGGLISFLAAAQTTAVNAVCAIGSRLSGMRATYFLSGTQRDILENTGEVTFTSRGRFLTLTNDFFAEADRLNPSDLLKSFPKPLMMVHGDQDEIVPVQEAYKAQALSDNGMELVVVEGADHMFSREDHRDRVSALVVDWFKKQIN